MEYRPTGLQKDTGRNVRDTLAFTVNIVSDAIAEAMNACAVPFEPGIDELTHAGLTALAGTAVPCPRIAEAPAALECRWRDRTTATELSDRFRDTASGCSDGCRVVDLLVLADAGIVHMEIEASESSRNACNKQITNIVRGDIGMC